MAKVQRDIVVSPTATAAYAWLAKPDEGQEFSDGKYKVTLVLILNKKAFRISLKMLERNPRRQPSPNGINFQKIFVIVLKMVTILTKKNLQTKL